MYLGPEGLPIYLLWGPSIYVVKLHEPFGEILEVEVDDSRII